MTSDRKFIKCPICNKRWTHPDLEFDPNPDDKTCSRGCLIIEQRNIAKEFLCKTSPNELKFIKCPSCKINWMSLDKNELANKTCSMCLINHNLLYDTSSEGASNISSSGPEVSSEI